MSDTDRLLLAGEAKHLLENKLLNDSLDKIEGDAIDEMIEVELENHELRQAKAAQAKACRSLRSELRAILANGEANQPRKGSIA